MVWLIGVLPGRCGVVVAGWSGERSGGDGGAVAEVGQVDADALVDGGGLLVRGEGAADAGLAVGLAGTLGQGVLDRRVAGETERRAELGGGGVQAGDRAPLVDLRGAPLGVQLVELRAGVDAGAGVLGRE